VIDECHVVEPVVQVQEGDTAVRQVSRGGYADSNINGNVTAERGGGVIPTDTHRARASDDVLVEHGEEERAV